MTSIIDFNNNFPDVSLIKTFTRKLTNPSLLELVVGSTVFGLVLSTYWSPLVAIPVILHFMYREKEDSEALVGWCLYSLLEDPQMRKSFLGKMNVPQVVEPGPNREEKTKWINDIVFHVWPVVNGLIQSELDRKGFSEKGLVMGGQDISVERFTLGDKYPVLSNITLITETKRTDEIVLDINVIFNSNCFILVKKTSILLIPFTMRGGVKDVGIRANGRLVFRPLIERSPYFGGVTFCLTESPSIVFEGINLNTIIGADALKSVIIKSLQPILISPQKISFPLGLDPEIKRRLLFPIPWGLCTFRIIQAKKLPADKVKVGLFKKRSGPVCAIGVGSLAYKTTVVPSDACDPVWEETFTSSFHDVYDLFNLEIYSSSSLIADNFVGSFTFKLVEFIKNEELNGRDRWVSLSCTSSSEAKVQLRVTCFRLSRDRKTVKDTMKKLVKGKAKFPVGLFCFYLLRTAYLGVEPKLVSPRITLEFGGHTYESEKKRKGKFVREYDEPGYFICNSISDVLKVTVIDTVSKEMVGTCQLTVNDLIDKGHNDGTDDERYHGFDFEGTLALRRVEEGSSTGEISLYACLRVCKIESKLYSFLKTVNNSHP